MSSRIYGRSYAAADRLCHAWLKLEHKRVKLQLCTSCLRSRQLTSSRTLGAAAATTHDSTGLVPPTTADYLDFINSDHIQNLKDIVNDQSIIKDIRLLLPSSDCTPESILQLWFKVCTPNSGLSQSIRRQILHYLSSHPSIEQQRRYQYIQSFVVSIPYKYRGANDHAYHIWALCHMDDYEEALKLWYKYTHASRNPSILKTGAFHALMLKLVKSSNWEEGLNLWRDAVSVYTEKVVRLRLGHEAKSLLRNLLSSVPDLHSWSLDFVENFVMPSPPESLNFARWAASEAVQVLCQADRLPEAQELVKACEQRKWVLRTAAYNKLLTCYLREHALEEALQLEQSMKEVPIAYNIVTYNLLLRLCGMMGDFRKLRATFEEIYAYHLVPNEWTYVSIMMSFATAGQVDMVEQLYEQFSSLGYKPDATIFSVLIYSRAMLLDVDGTAKWLNELEAQNIKPSLRFYETLCRYFSDSGDVEGAFTCYRAIYVAGLKPSPVVYNSLMTLLADRGDSEAAVQIYSMMTAEGWSNVGETKCLITLMDAFASSHNVGKALEVFNYIKSTKSNPSRYAWTVLMKAYFAANDGLRARRTFHEAIFQGVKPDVAMYTLLLEIENHLAGPQRAAEIFDECVATGIKPDSRLYTTLMDVYHSAGQYSEVLRCVDEMFEKQISPTYVTLAVVINALTEIDTAEGTHRAQDYLDVVVAAENHFDISSKYSPRTALSPDIFVPLVRKATKTRFLSSAASSSAQEVWQLYKNKSASKDGQRTKPNLYLLTEMLHSACKAQDITAASRWWQSVLDTAVSMAGEIDVSLAGTKSPLPRKKASVSNSHKHVLCKPWSYLANLLAYQENWDEIERSWDQVQSHGFELDTFNWNERVRYCAISRRNLIWASEMCEEHLLEKWIKDDKHVKRNQNSPGYELAWKGQNRKHLIRERTLNALQDAFSEMQGGEPTTEVGEAVPGLDAIKYIKARCNRLYTEVEKWAEDSNIE